MIGNRACELVGCEFPLFAFSHCRDVVAAVSRSGGFGVLGASSHSPEELEQELAWIDAHVDGNPYGVDILVPENLAAVSDGPVSVEELATRIPAAHREFVATMLRNHGIEVSDSADLIQKRLPSSMPEIGEKLMEVAFRHPIRLIANALGIAPPSMIERGQRHGVPVAALVGAKEHALRQALAGVDLIVAQGTEAGGHCGEVATLVLVPEVIAALNKAGFEIPVLAAGGISTGGQMAGCTAMGAAGAWTGSVWLATPEAETTPLLRNKIVEASSRDTIRSKLRTGKPSRQLRSHWHDAWEVAGSPEPLPMPMMSMLAQPAFAKIDKATLAGNQEAEKLASYWVGQGIGLIDSIRSAEAVVHQFRDEFVDAYLRLRRAVGEDS